MIFSLDKISHLALQRLIFQLRFIFKSFKEDQCLLRASALTYVTALSIVPFLAVAFSISKGFGMHHTKYIKDFLLGLSAEKTVIVEHILDYINRTNVSTLGTLGIVVLLITVFSLLGTVEQSLNAVWGVKKQRTLGRKFSDYLSVTLVCPMLIIAAFSFSASLQSTAIVQRILSFSVLSYIYLFFLKLLPFFLICLSLFFLYKFMPNTQVKTRTCLVGTFIGGLLWYTAQTTFISYQIGVSKYNAIYGSFAQLPLFLIWLYLSWVIVLFGAEVGFSLENYQVAKPKSSLGIFNLENKEKLALTLMLDLTERFNSGKQMPGAGVLSNDLGIPLKPVNQVLFALCAQGLVAVSSDNGEDLYLPAKSPGTTSCLEVLQAVLNYKDQNELQEIPLVPNRVNQYFKRHWQTLAEDKGLDLSLDELSKG